MSIAGILSSSALTTASALQNSLKQKQTEFQHLAQALQSGTLSSAQQVPGAPTQSATSSSVLNPQLSQDFSSLGSDLQSGNLTAAQKAYSALQQDVQNAGSGEHVHHHHGGGLEHTPLTARFVGSSPDDATQVAQNPILPPPAGLSITA